jgi:hypothetical protein
MDGAGIGVASDSEPESLGRPDAVLVEIALPQHDDEALKRFGRAVAALPEVWRLISSPASSTISSRSPSPALTFITFIRSFSVGAFIRSMVFATAAPCSRCDA